MKDMKTIRNLLWACAGGALLVACAELPPLVSDKTCGNGIIEPTNYEDCEPGRALADGLQCGEVGDELECLFVCADDDGEGTRVAECPRGWGCSLDGYCQAPAGEFGDPLIIQGITTPLAIGDFDGDDYPDLATVQEPLLRVAFGNAATQYAVSLRAPIESAPSDPQVIDLNGDDLDDLAVTSGSRVNIYLGRADQNVAPLLLRSREYDDLPIELRLVPATMNEPYLRQQPVMLAASPSGGLTVQLADFDDADVLTLDGATSVLPDRVASGDLLADASDPPRHELAVAPYRETRVTLLTLDCEIDPDAPLLGDGFDPDCELIEAGQVSAPTGWQLSAAGTFIGDVDGDGLDDLIFGVQGPQGRALAAALNTGDGLAEAFVLPIIYEGEGPPAVMPGAQMMAQPSWFLAVADLDGNGRVDVVTATGLQMAADGAPDDPIAFEPGYVPGRRLTMARVTDLNRDGLPDIVATIGPSLVTQLNVDGQRFNELETTMGDQATDLLVGDLDGDLLPDILVQVGNELQVGFNNGRGSIDELQEAVSETGAVTPVILRWAADTDAIDDLLVVVVPPEDVPYLLELQGSGTRRLAAPLRLPEVIDSVARIIGPEKTHVGLVGDRTEAGWMFIAVDRSTLFDSQVRVVPPPLAMEGDCAFATNADLMFTAFRPTGAADWEALAAVESLTETVPDAYTGPWAPRVLIYRGEDTLTCVRLGESPLSEPPTGMVVDDIDGDGHADLVLAHPSQRGPMGGEADGIGGLAVWWGDREGGFREAPVAVEREGAFADSADERRAFRGPLAAIELDGEPGKELVMLFGNGLQVLDHDDGEFGDPRLIENQRLDPEDVERIDAVDLDQDGVTDLLLSGSSQTAFMAQVPCTPQEDAEGECVRRVVGPEEE